MNLSIIIPIYNSELYLNRCIDSLYRQNLKPEDFEIILINDGSTDQSLRICEQYKAKYSNISLFSIKKSGVSAARNIGIENAVGEYIHFVDSDDYLKNYTLEPILCKALENQIDILGFKMTRTTKENDFQSNWNGKVTDNLNIYSGKAYLKDKHYYNDSSCWFLIRKELVMKSQIKFSTKTSVAEDLLFTSSIFLKASRVAFVPVNVYQYVINPDSTWNNKNPAKIIKKINDFIYVCIVFNDFVKSLELSDSFEIFCLRRNLLVRNTLKRILESDLGYHEIENIIIPLEENGLFPLDNYVPKNIKQLKTTIINLLIRKKKRFLLTAFLYRKYKRLLKK